MKSIEIRKKFIDFFSRRGHKFMPPISLIPENDPTLLFTNSGMVQFKNYFLGLEKPKCARMVNYQPSFRTIDIEKVGTNDRTLTFFEMLGSWSVGDPTSPVGLRGASYFKKEAIELAWDLLTKNFKFPKNKLWVTVFRGDKNIPADKESIKHWLSVGVPKEKIVKLGTKDNFWIAGEIGPCGPSTEVYYDQGKNIGCGKKNCQPGCDCDRFLEIWNAGVFMQYNKQVKSGKVDEYEYKPLKTKSVDTGAGLERLAAVLQDKDSVFEIDVFRPIVNKIYALIGCREGAKPKTYKSIRIIADHIRGSVFLIGDGIFPSNKAQGYVLRRLIRRIIVHGRLLGIKEKFTVDLAKIVIKTMNSFYPYLEKAEKNVLEILNKEEINFNQTIDRGLKEFNKIISQKPKKISGESAFLLYDSFGFPLELTEELADKENISVDKAGFTKKLDAQKEQSRTASKGFFKGGLVGGSDNEIKLHTATHLLLAALRELLSPDIYQRGSNINAERLRFDFNYSEKLNPKQIQTIEALVNKKIQENIPVEMSEMPKKDALKISKVSFDSSKYGDIVKVYKIGDFSIELCGGPHVKNTKELGSFKIIKEESSSAGIRRIKAIIE